MFLRTSRRSRVTADTRAFGKTRKSRSISRPGRRAIKPRTSARSTEQVSRLTGLKRPSPLVEHLLGAGRRRADTEARLTACVESDNDGHATPTRVGARQRIGTRV